MVHGSKYLFNIDYLPSTGSLYILKVPSETHTIIILPWTAYLNFLFYLLTYHTMKDNNSVCLRGYFENI